MNSTSKRVFTSFSLGSLSLKNRIVMAPMCMYSSDHLGMVTPFHMAHYTARAYGGVSLVILEATAVESRGRISENDLQISTDDHIEPLKQLVKAIHLGGAKVAIQLAHAGRKANVKNQSSIAPSAITFSESYKMPIAMTVDDINTVIHSFKEAARRAQTAGIDGIEIHGAHGYLINQFLSPLSNQRTDEYGGNLENRTRFLKQILTEVRSVFRGEVWVRLSVEEYAEGSHHIEDTLKVLSLIRPLIAGVNVSSGGAVPFPIQAGKGYQLGFASQLKKAGFTTICGGLIETFEEVEEALANDQGDFVYLGRALLLNPYFVLQHIKKHEPTLMLDAYKRG